MDSFVAGRRNIGDGDDEVLLTYPYGLGAVDTDNNLFIADGHNNQVIQVKEWE